MSPDSPTPLDPPSDDAGIGTPDPDATTHLPRIEDEILATRELPAHREPQYRAAPPPYAPAPPVAEQSASSTKVPTRNPFATLWWIAAGLLLLFVIVLVAMYVSRGQGPASPSQSASASPSLTSSPSASPSPSVTASPSPSPSPSPTPTVTAAPVNPPANSATFVAWDAPASASCTSETDSVEVTITWISANAVKAWIGVDTDNAKEEPYADAPTSGSYTLGFPCTVDVQRYTVTLEDAEGDLTHKSVDISSGLS